MKDLAPASRGFVSSMSSFVILSPLQAVAIACEAELQRRSAGAARELDMEGPASGNELSASSAATVLCSLGGQMHLSMV